MAAAAAHTANREPVDYVDLTCQFFGETPKNCIKTLRYTLSWASLFFRNLKSYPQYTDAASALKHGTAIFIWPEFLSDMNALRLKTIEWINQGSDVKHATVTAATLSIAFSDALNKVCDLTQWLVDTNLFSLSRPVLSNLTLINGLTLMYSFGNRAVTTFTELQYCKDNNKSLKMWKLAKNISLFALGALITISSFTTLINPAFMLICSTTALVASYSTYILEHPLCTSISKS